jgi:hypothetical protein
MGKEMEEGKEMVLRREMAIGKIMAMVEGEWDRKKGGDKECLIYSWWYSQQRRIYIACSVIGWGSMNLLWRLIKLGNLVILSFKEV